jgi:hypothetical protein
MIAIADGGTVSLSAGVLPGSNAVLYLPAVGANNYTLSIDGNSYVFDFPSSGNTFTVNSKTINLGDKFAIGGQRYIFVGKGSAILLGDGPVSRPQPPSIAIRPRVLDQKLTFYWGSNFDNGGGDITGYILSNATASFSNNYSSNVYSATATSLTNGTSYTFQLYATNSVGTSDPTYYRKVIPGTPPSDPQNVVSSYTSGDTTANITWDAPASDGGAALLGYVVIAQSSNPADPVIKRGTQADRLYFNLRDLNAASTYTFKIYAVNDPGYSPGVSF